MCIPFALSYSVLTFWSRLKAPAPKTKARMRNLIIILIFMIILYSLIVLVICMMALIEYPPNPYLPPKQNKKIECANWWHLFRLHVAADRFISSVHVAAEQCTCCSRAVYMLQQSSVHIAAEQIYLCTCRSRADLLDSLLPMLQRRISRFSPLSRFITLS